MEPCFPTFYYVYFFFSCNIKRKLKVNAKFVQLLSKSSLTCSYDSSSNISKRKIC